MTDKKEKIREFIQNNPSLSGNETLNELKKLGLGIRKTNFLEIYRNEKKLPEPSKVKREASIPIKYRKQPLKPKPKPITKVRTKPITKPTIQTKLPKIPYEKTKFGKMAKDIEKKHGISEKKAIIRTRVLLKIPKKDYNKLNRKDQFVLLQHGY